MKKEQSQKNNTKPSLSKDEWVKKVGAYLDKNTSPYGKASIDALKRATKDTK